MLKEQFGFCAYSERFVRNSDSVHIEHFYPKEENPAKEDDYENLYAVLAWPNENKAKKIKPFLPILEPHSAELPERIIYKEGLFEAADPKDKAADNLIKFLGFNKYEIVEDRKRHLSRVRQLRHWKTESEFLEYLETHREELSFPTALEHEFGIDAIAIIRKNG